MGVKISNCGQSAGKIRIKNIFKFESIQFIMNIGEENEKHGNEAAIKFKYLQQDTQTLSFAFKKYFSGKRPDFLILIPNLGFIFVDVKYKKLSPDYKTYPIDSEETKNYSSIQRKFNLNIWYVLSNEDIDYKTWFWIPISKVFESGEPIFTSNKSKMNFYAVPPENFIQIAIDDSLDRLLSKCFLDETKKIN